MFAKVKTEKLNYLQLVTSSSVFQILMFSILTAVAAQITIPAKPVPFTLQTLLVVLSGAILGSRKGAYSQILYLAMGVSGLPVFAHMPDAAAGFARLFGPTGGYLLAFPAAAFFTGLILEHKKGYVAAAAAMLAGEALIIFSGVSYLFVFWVKDINQALAAGAVVFSVWTVIKVIAGTSIYKALTRNR